MFIVGLVLLVLGSATAVEPVAMLGVSIAVLALWAAYLSGPAGLSARRTA